MTERSESGLQPAGAVEVIPPPPFSFGRRPGQRGGGGPRSMTIRIKIFALATTLLVVLAIALGVSLRLQEDVADELAGITEYHLPVLAHVADVDVFTFEYELLLARLVDNAAATPADLEATEARERQLIGTIDGAFASIEDLMTRASLDARNDLSDRLTFSHQAGIVGLLRRDIDGFEETGLQVLNAYRAGSIPEAHQAMTGFRNFERAFGQDLANIRTAIRGLTDESTSETLGQQVRLQRLSFLLFAIAAAAGLGMSWLIATRMVSALHRLVSSAHALEQGETFPELPVTSRDEIGQLTRAFNRMTDELKAKARIQDTFGRYVDPRIVANLIGTSEAELNTAERRVLTVFFSDIKGFSGISEQLTAGAIAKLLNHYFTIVTGLIRQHNGVIDKYIGDSVMAFWTAPFSAGEEHAADGCLAAIAQRDAIALMLRDLPEVLGLRRDVPEFKVRMGLATGEAVVGTIGAPTARSYTVIGDTVNLASRLEGINRVFGTGIVIAEETYRLAQGVIEARELDIVTVSGKTEPVRVYELLGLAGGISAGVAELRSIFAQGLAAYRQQDWPTAAREFAECLARDPNDGPSRVFAARVVELTKATPSGWDGVWHIGEK